jgi:hypothetical protein
LLDSGITGTKSNSRQKLNLFERTFRERNPAQSTFDTIYRSIVKANEDLCDDLAVASERLAGQICDMIEDGVLTTQPV